MCVVWREDLYEHSLDAKKLFKKSVSHIIADAIVKYLNEVIIEIMSSGSTYNYDEFYFILTKNHSHTYIQISVSGDPGPETIEKLLKL